MNEELYTPQEVADLLKIKKNTVYELIKRGELKCRKIGKQFRIRKDELEEYLNTANNNMTAGVTAIRDMGKSVKISDITASPGTKVPDTMGACEHGIMSADIIPRAEHSECASPGTKVPDTMRACEHGIIKPDKSAGYEKPEIKEQTGKADIADFNINLENNIAGEPYNNRGLVICGQDILLEILCNYLSGQLEDLPIFRSYLGSYNGLYALYQGKVDVATAHLWDGETGEYNKQFVKRMLPGIAYRRIHLIKRMQGFYVKEGNPKQIKDFGDLIRDDITMINREKGSGTRILLDQHLLKLEVKTSQINGYGKEVTSHLACAGVIARGGADVAVGTERISRELKGIDFIPIQMENYDLVVKMESTRYNWYQKLIRIINSGEFKEELERLSGYDTTDIGKILD